MKGIVLKITVSV